MDAVLSVAEGHMDSEEYYLDLDADAGVEDFDFRLDGTYNDETQQAPTDTGLGDPGNSNADFEIGYEDDEGHAGHIENEHVEEEDDEAEKDVLDDAGMDYQDEIGYEDEEPSAANAAADQGIGEIGSPSVGKSESTSDGQGEHSDNFDKETQLPETAVDLQGDQFTDFEEPSGKQPLHGSFCGHQAQDMPELNDAADPGVETTDESAQQSVLSNGRTPASGMDDSEGSADISNTPSAVPEITVHYNQGQYTLIGAPTDDPDTYFFSDEKELDGSLLQFLGSIRAVISDEVTTEDELTIRIDALNLEFGERSNQKFLGRSFRDVLTCYSALATASSRPVSYDPHNLELELLVRQDCEARFLELLEEAGIVGELSHLPDHPDDFDGAKNSTLVQGEGEGEIEDQLYEEQSAEDYSEGYNPDDEDVDILGQDDTTQAATREEKQVETEAAPEAYNGYEETSGSILQTYSVDESAEFFSIPASGYEEGYQEAGSIPAEEGGQGEGDYADPDIDVSGPFSRNLEDESAAEEDLRESKADTDAGAQPTKEQDGLEWDDEAGEQAGSDSGEHLTIGDADATPLPESASHDVDLNLASDEVADSALIREHGYSGDNILDVTGAQDNDLQQTTANGHGSVGVDQPAYSTISNEVDSVDVPGTKSKGTSRTSTVNGDETNFQEHSLVDEFLTLREETFQPVDALGAENDEIDWENDADESEQKATMTPSSVSGKRGRTNDAESLTDEADYKRRRT